MDQEFRSLLEEFKGFDGKTANKVLNIGKYTSESMTDTIMKQFDIISANLTKIHSQWTVLEKVDINDLTEINEYLTRFKLLKSKSLNTNEEAPALSILLLFENLEKISTKIVQDLRNETIAKVKIGEIDYGKFKIYFVLDLIEYNVFINF